MIANPTAAKLLQEVGVDVLGLFDLTDVLFDKNKRRDEEDSDREDNESKKSDDLTLSFGDLMEQVLELRGSNNATVKDVMNLRHVVRVHIDSRLEKIERQFPPSLLSPRSSGNFGEASQRLSDHSQPNSPR